MIRYPVTLMDLENAAEREKKGWLKKANNCTAKCKSKKRYVDQGNIWGEIKGVYMRIQYNKCVYCERKLASMERINPDGTVEMIGPGKVEHDVEHFRPKSSVKQWPTAKIAKDRKVSYTFPLGSAANLGYYLLAHKLLNYATSCKTCNTPLKSNFFPVQGPRKTSLSDPAKAKSEKALLLYPIGDIDDDPEAVITFDGWLAKPVSRTGEKFRRAAVTIDFFELDTREELIRERALAIVAMYFAFDNISSPNALKKRLAQRNIYTYTAPRSAHTSCCRAYLKVLQSDPHRALDLATQAQAYLDSES
jgi:hypothetical protein